MTFSIVGTGNTAWFMATRLAAAGCSCTGIYGRNAESAKSLADRIGSTSYDLSNGVKDDADICILAVSDHAIGEVVASLSFSKGVLIHTAGSVNINAIKGAATHTGVMWPVYSIVKDNLPETKDIPIVWEASDDLAKKIISATANAISNISHEADSSQRISLHLTAVISNNFTNHLFAIAEQICAEKNLPFTLLYPIIQQSVNRLASLSPATQQTGPAKRRDTATMQRQLDMLGKHPQWQRIYEAISVSIMEMYKD